MIKLETGKFIQFFFNFNFLFRKLLWHGSRISNWYGILSQGLRIAPPEAPVVCFFIENKFFN